MLTPEFDASDVNLLVDIVRNQRDMFNQGPQDIRACVVRAYATPLPRRAFLTADLHACNKLDLLSAWSSSCSPRLCATVS